VRYFRFTIQPEAEGVDRSYHTVNSYVIDTASVYQFTKWKRVKDPREMIQLDGKTRKLFPVPLREFLGPVKNLVN
jgi:hypothetical protein